MTDDLVCCYMNAILDEECSAPAEWVVWDGVEPAYDHEIHACAEHVGDMLSDSDNPHLVYPVEWLT